jgi:hypothetical protein
MKRGGGAAARRGSSPGELAESAVEDASLGRVPGASGAEPTAGLRETKVAEAAGGAAAGHDARGGWSGELFPPRQGFLHLAVGDPERKALLDPPHHFVRCQGSAVERRGAAGPIDLQPGHRGGERFEHRCRALDAPHQRLLEQLVVTVVPAGERALDLEHREQIALHRARPSPGQLEQIRVPLVRHDAAAGRQLRRKGQVAEFLGAVENDIAGKPGEVMRNLGAPEERGGLQLSAAALHGGDVAVEPAEAERACRDLPPDRQRDAIARRAAQRTAIHLCPQPAHRFGGVEKPLRIGAGPESHR